MFLVIPGQPVAKGRPKFGRGRTYTPAKTIAAETFIQLCAQNAKVEKMEGPLRLTVTFSMQIPKSWNKSDKEGALSGAIRPTGKPDVDNLVKLVGDSLEAAGAYDNDSQIVEVMAVKKYGKPETIILLERIE